MYINITVIEVGFYEFHEGVPAVEFSYLFFVKSIYLQTPKPIKFYSGPILAHYRGNKGKIKSLMHRIQHSRSGLIIYIGQPLGSVVKLRVMKTKAIST